MLSRRRFRLVTLGRLELSASAGEVFHVEDVRPRHLAVLAVLALARQPISRDALVEMFWGGETDERARHTLSNALSALRAILGPNAISARNDTVSLDESARLEVDAIQFLSACEVRDDERAIALYGGELLHGVRVQDAAAFDRWLDRERGRLARDFQQACERCLPTLLRSGKYDQAAHAADRWLEAAPQSTLAFTSLLRARAGAGTAAALTDALSEFDRLRDLLWREHEVRPHEAVVALTTELREQLATAVAREQRASSSSQAAEPTAPAPAAEASLTANRSNVPLTAARPTRSPTRIVQAVAIALVVVVLVTAGGLWLRRNSLSAASRRPIVAVTSIDDVAGDTSVAWLRAGLPRLIASDLDAMGGVEVVAPSRVREVTVRLAGSSSQRITEAQAIDIARRVGATWVVIGGVSAAKDGYLLDLTARQVGKQNAAQSFTVLSPDLIELGKLAASRLASAFNIESSGSGSRSQSADLAAANPVAYQHFARGLLAVESGRFADASHDFDSAIANDSGFADAVRLRRGLPRDQRTDVVLAGLERRFANRLSEFERLADQIRLLDTLGDRSASEALSEQFVSRFTHDPRAYSVRADLLIGHGKWAAAEQVLLRELALDSLAMSAGNGPCTPCEVLWRLSQVRLLQGNPTGALESANRWAALQPDLPSAWRNLSATLAVTGHPAEALAAGLHLTALSNEPSAAVDFGRSMIAARRYDIVDSLVAAWRTRTDSVLIEGGRDLHALVQRERGQFVASLATLADIRPPDGLILMRADALARLGHHAEAQAILELSAHPFGPTSGHLLPPQARGFCWGHALEADEMLSHGDTSNARMIIDSLQRVGPQSYYGRDRLLYHHVQGMLYYAEGKYADAERELRAAEWSKSSWTRTNVELSRAQLAQGHLADALSTLRDAYLSPMDGMGRYVPRSELDWWMARTFTAAGQKDSARVYADYVRSAWRHADPSVAAKLDSLPR